MLNWKILKFISNKFTTSALILLVVTPYMVIYLKALDIDIKNIQISVAGAILFILLKIVYFSFSPKLINDVENENKYVEKCFDNDINPYDEFTFIKVLTAEEIKNKFIESTHLFPINNGLEHARNETIKKCSQIEFDYINTSKVKIRWGISAGYVISILLMNYPGILRLISIYI